MFDWKKPTLSASQFAHFPPCVCPVFFCTKIFVTFFCEWLNGSFFALLASHLCHHEAWCWAWRGTIHKVNKLFEDCSTSCVEGFLLGDCGCSSWFHACASLCFSGSTCSVVQQTKCSWDLRPMVKLVQSSHNLANTLCGVGGSPKRVSASELDPQTRCL